MKDFNKEQPQPRLVTMGEEMLETLRPSEWGDVTPNVTNLTTGASDEVTNPGTEAEITVSRHVSRIGVSFAFTEAIPGTDAPLEPPIDTGDRNHSTNSIQDTTRSLLDNQQ